MKQFKKTWFCLPEVECSVKEQTSMKTEERAKEAKADQRRPSASRT